MDTTNTNPDNDEQTVVTLVSIYTGIDGDADAGMFTTMSMEYSWEPVSHSSISNNGDDSGS